MKMTKELRTFLELWLSWAEGREDPILEAKRRFGLCISLNYWVRKGGTAEQVFHLEEELDLLFDHTGLDTVYPFGERNYQRMKDSTQDQNRVSWVKAVLNDTIESWEMKE